MTTNHLPPIRGYSDLPQGDVCPPVQTDAGAFSLSNPPPAGFGFIYKITSPSGKAYIGKTVLSLYKRWSVHCGKHTGCTYLSNAIKKYGRGSMKISLLGVFNVSEIGDHEKRLIAEHGCLSPGGYNITSGGDTPCVYESTRAKHSEQSKKMWANPDRREALSEQVKARWKDPAYRAIMKAHSDKRWNDEEEHRKTSFAWKKVWESREYREKMIATKKQACASEKWRKNKSSEMKKKWKDPEYRRIQAAHIKNRWDDPVYKAKMSALRTGKLHTEEEKRKISDALRGKKRSPEAIANMRFSRWNRRTVIQQLAGE